MDMSVKIPLRKLHPEAQLPTRATPGSIGLDVYAHILTNTGRPGNLLLPANCTRPVPTGLIFDYRFDPRVTCPWLVQVCSRSGLAAKSIFVANAPGIIDPDYIGELIVLLYNGSHTSYYVNHGDRVAQLVTVQANLSGESGEEETRPTRGAKGLGSTGR